MTDRRHQVFLSSTYVDLIAERSEVMQALLELECMPAGMELFPAANDTQWDWIKRVIDESDYYILIIGGRYGSIAKETGISFTEMEYRYAVERGKPVIGFLHEDPSSLAAKLVEQNSARTKKLDSFRDLVKSRLCKFYSSPSDLGAKVSRSITQLKKQYPRPGWVRAELLDNVASSDEVLQLRRENDELQARIEQYGLEAPRALEYLSSGDDEVQLDFVFVREVLNESTGRYRKHSEEWSSIKLSWNEIFRRVGPDLISKNTQYWHASNPLSSLIERAAYPKLEKKYQNERFTNFRVAYASVDTVMLQLRALKLVGLDDDKHWEITPYGDNYLTSLLGVPKGAARAPG